MNIPEVYIGANTLAKELYEPLILLEPAAGSSFYHSPLLMMWECIFAVLFLACWFVHGRKNEVIGAVELFGIIFGILVVGVGLINFQPALWWLYSNMPEGPAALAEFSAIVLYLIVSFALVFVAGQQARRLGIRSYFNH